MTAVRRADVCAAAIADCFRHDGEILANPIGTLPVIGARLARELYEPRLVITDGAAMLAGDTPAYGAAPAYVEGWNPYRRMFDVLWNGRRHVMMGASQIDRHGNQNLAAIGDPVRPKVQLIGFRGAPGNTINNPTSYWIARHTPRVFVERVDVVCGIGYDRAAELGPVAARFHDLRAVVTDLAVLDFATADRRMRLRSVHPGVRVGDVVAATGFELAIGADVPETRPPTAGELAALDRLDPADLRGREVPG
ncbi:MAG TPA: CoA-transferase [Streptosporangiaceae bacterium]|jgi:acyl CoA:acetate/3-ketoacid CoA transferase beta subunit